LKNPKSRNTKPIVKSELQLGGGGEQQVANLFNQVGHMIESILHNNWLLRLHCFTISFCLGLVEKAFPFGSLILWPVLQQQLEQACCCSHHSIPSPHHILTNEANSFSACQVASAEKIRDRERHYTRMWIFTQTEHVRSPNVTLPNIVHSNGWNRKVCLTHVSWAVAFCMRKSTFSCSVKFPFPFPNTEFSQKQSLSPRFLSRVLVNWFSAGGTLRRWFSTRRCLCILTYLGHFTNRCKSLFGGRAPPIPNCFGRFSNKGLATFTAFSGAWSNSFNTRLRHPETPSRKS